MKHSDWQSGTIPPKIAGGYEYRFLARDPQGDGIDWILMNTPLWFIAGKWMNKVTIRGEEIMVAVSDNLIFQWRGRIDE